MIRVSRNSRFLFPSRAAVFFIRRDSDLLFAGGPVASVLSSELVFLAVSRQATEFTVYRRAFCLPDAADVGCRGATVDRGLRDATWPRAASEERNS